MQVSFIVNQNQIIRRYKNCFHYSVGFYRKLISLHKRVKGVSETSGTLLRENTKTVIVQLNDGNIIKRHKAKHFVK